MREGRLLVGMGSGQNKILCNQEGAARFLGVTIFSSLNQNRVVTGVY